MDGAVALDKRHTVKHVRNDSHLEVRLGSLRCIIAESTALGTREGGLRLRQLYRYERTACLWLSFTISRNVGLNAVLSFDVMSA